MPLIYEEDRQRIDEKIQRIVSGASRVETEIHRVIRPDGSIGWQEWTDQAIQDEHGNLIELQSVGRDITERKQAEKAVLESEQRYRALFEDMPIAIWEEDISLVKEHLEALKQQGVTDFRAYFAKQPDAV
jgi:PAS domain-containing protein